MTNKVTSEKNKTTRLIKNSFEVVKNYIFNCSNFLANLLCYVKRQRLHFFGSRRRNRRKERNINCGWTLKWFGHIAINQAEHKLQNIKQN
jgi:hypothetical protein